MPTLALLAKHPFLLAAAALPGIPTGRRLGQNPARPAVAIRAAMARRVRFSWMRTSAFA